MYERSEGASPDVTSAPVTAAFQKLRTAQDAEMRAIEALLLYELQPQSNNVDTALDELDRAIEEHRKASEELTNLKMESPMGNGERFK